ncbi:hypothetical protein PILCRDRAFT_15462 [Piloderma croceum F 1598]|uniref:Uncharacterized protein n=1 Tax=Piloderma croceum (strain F 1598) TaxID=765440 RepID=A0A0C3EYZ1_PILCF|nr:hypothetical protein PILCRDRAFT_15462 [Piloderma croceum F 1598]
MSGLASLFVLRMSLSMLRRAKHVLSFPDVGSVTTTWSGFSHAPRWAREERAGTKTGTPVYSYKSIPLIARRDTCSLLNLP